MNINRLSGALFAILVAATLAGCDSSEEASSPVSTVMQASSTEAGATPTATVIEENSPTQGAPPTAAGGDQWLWPVEGELKTLFGPEHPVGIDIRAPLETEVRAAQAGTATFVGGDPCCDNGYHVIIEHGEGFETLYGHLGGFQVAPGASVNAGDVIGSVGMTGETDEPHLHFEIRQAGAYLDPLNFLP